MSSIDEVRKSGSTVRRLFCTLDVGAAAEMRHFALPISNSQALLFQSVSFKEKLLSFIS